MLSSIRNIINSNLLQPSLPEEKAFLIVFYCSVVMSFFSLAVLQLCSVVLIVLSLIKVVRSKSWESTSLDLLLFLFLLARILSVFLSMDFARSMPILYKEIPFYFLYYAVTQQRHLFSWQRMYTAIVLFLVAGAITSVYGIAMVVLGVHHRAESFTSGYYTFGTLLTIALACTFLWGKSFFGNSRKQWYLLLALLTTALLFTLNRIHIGIVFLVFLFGGLWRERKALSVVVISVLLLILVSPSLQQRLYETIYFRSHMSNRDLLWSGALTIASHHPFFGYGPNTFEIIFPFNDSLTDKGTANWHNDYIQTYIESGAVGLFFLLLLLGMYYLHSIRSLRTSVLSEEKREIQMALVSGITVVILAAFTGNAIYDVLVRIVFMEFLAFSNILMSHGKE